MLDTERDYRVRLRGARRAEANQVSVDEMPGAGLSDGRNGKALSDMPAFQPYWGKPAVRNDRGDGGNVGIIRSPLRATVLPDCGGRSVMVVPTATTEIRMPANFRVARQPPPIPQFSKRDSIWSISATNDALS